MIRESLAIALDNVSHRKTRAILTILGIVIGIAAIITLVSLGDGLENAISEEFAKIGADTIQVVQKGMRGPPSGKQVITEDDISTVENVKGVDYALGFYSSSGEVRFGREEEFASIWCYEDDEFERGYTETGNELEQGRVFKENEKGKAVISHGFSKDLFKKEVRLKNSIYVKDKKFSVIGIEEDTGVGSSSVILTLDDCDDIFERNDGLSGIMLKTMQGFDPPTVADDITDRLKKKKDEENFEVYTSEQLLEQLTSLLGIISVILSAIAAISLLVGATGIMNSMYTNVLERTKDIGVMKSIGAKRSQILMMFLVEAGLYGLVGGIVGVGLGMGLSKLVEIIAVQGFGFTLLKIKFNIAMILGTLTFSFIIGCISGIFPSLRASKLQPVDALRYE